MIQTTFQQAQIQVGSRQVLNPIVIYIDGNFIKRGIPIWPVYFKLEMILFAI